MNQATFQIDENPDVKLTQEKVNTEKDKLEKDKLEKVVKNSATATSNTPIKPKTPIKIVENICLTNKYQKNLEIGPGIVPFLLATDFIGSNENIKNYIDIDIDNQLFPYKDNEIDFVYCRHVLEDIQNPDFALQEIFRVTKDGGYIETPSPLIEITKDVDANNLSNIYCGYVHHRYIVWSDIEKCEIYFLPKYSSIIDNYFLLHLEK